MKIFDVLLKVGLPIDTRLRATRSQLDIGGNSPTSLNFCSVNHVNQSGDLKKVPHQDSAGSDHARGGIAKSPKLGNTFTGRLSWDAGVLHCLTRRRSTRYTGKHLHGERKHMWTSQSQTIELTR